MSPQSRISTLQCVAILAMFLMVVGAGCSVNQELVPYCGAWGTGDTPKPLVYRYHARAIEGVSGTALPDVLVGAKHAEDSVVQVDFTGADGIARLSQEYADAKWLRDRRYFLFVKTQDEWTLRVPPWFQVSARHPLFGGRDQRFGPDGFIELPRDAGTHG